MRPREHHRAAQGRPRSPCAAQHARGKLGLHGHRLARLVDQGLVRPRFADRHAHPRARRIRPASRPAHEFPHVRAALDSHPGSDHPTQPPLDRSPARVATRAAGAVSPPRRLVTFDLRDALRPTQIAVTNAPPNPRKVSMRTATTESTARPTRSAIVYPCRPDPQPRTPCAGYR